MCFFFLHIFFFFFNAPPPTEIYTLSLHDALPISFLAVARLVHPICRLRGEPAPLPHRDRKSTRLNSSHVRISYAVFCLKKKKKTLSILLCLKKKNKNAIRS